MQNFIEKFEDKHEEISASTGKRQRVGKWAR